MCMTDELHTRQSRTRAYGLGFTPLVPSNIRVRGTIITRSRGKEKTVAKPKFKSQ